LTRWALFTTCNITPFHVNIAKPMLFPDVHCVCVCVAAFPISWEFIKIKLKWANYFKNCTADSIIEIHLIYIIINYEGNQLPYQTICFFKQFFTY
jgi:hypothetical protein